VAIYRFTVSCLDQRDGLCFTQWHIWSFKRCLERMYDLNVTMQH